MTLQETFKNAAELYIKAFVKKQGYEFTDWVGEPFQIAVFIDQYFINFDDVRYDIDNECEKGLIFKYHDEILEAYHAGAYIVKTSYSAYSKGISIIKTT